MRSPPELSVIIPCFGRSHLLGACLEALERQTLDRERFEVIVVDDGSPEPLEENLVPRPGLDLRSHRQAQSGPATARNAGAALARGNLLVFTDSDCRPDPEWLRHLQNAYRLHPAGTCFAGHTVNALRNRPCSEASQHLIDYLFAYFDKAEEEGGFVTSGNMACPAREFHELGGFSDAFRVAGGEDRYFGLQWVARIGPVRLVPEAVIHHHHALGPREFFRQHIRYGKGARTCHRLLRENGETPLPPQPLSFYLGILRYAFGLPDLSLVARLRLSALMGGTQVANVIGFFLGD